MPVCPTFDKQNKTISLQQQVLFMKTYLHLNCHPETVPTVVLRIKIKYASENVIALINGQQIIQVSSIC